jgi:hypothetical protein
MDVVFLFYVFLSLVIATGGSYVLASSGRIVAALVYFLGIIGIEAFFGMRWFNGTTAKVADAGPWPPVMNTCPDFLSLYYNGDKAVCVDTIGVAPNGGIAKWTGNADDRFVFNLHLDKSGAERIKALCAESKAKMVTWEGVYDGSNCLNAQPPLPVKKA